MDLRSKPEDRQTMIETMAALKEPVKITDIAASLRKSNQFTRIIVNDLLTQGIVVKTGSMRSARYALDEHITTRDV